MIRQFFALLIQNTVSMLGTAIALSALTLMVALFVVQAMGFEGGPYLGILTFLILPMFFVLGLLMIPSAFCGNGVVQRRPPQPAKHRRCFRSST